MIQKYPTSFEIAGRKLSPPLVLSPMAGVTDSPFRRIAKKCGDIGLIVTEFISVEGLTRGNMRTHEMMRFAPEERPIAIQIFGFDEVRMRWAAEIAEEAGADFVDINCGCPAKKVVNGGGGSNLLRDLPQLKKILTEVKRAISIPMTVKSRAGWDDKSITASKSPSSSKTAAVRWSRSTDERVCKVTKALRIGIWCRRSRKLFRFRFLAAVIF